MTITLKTSPMESVIEFGGGKYPRIRPNLDCRMCHDDNGNPTVDLVADFNEPIPLETESYDGIFSQYAFEHISWRKARQFVSEILRILKPGGKCILVVPNTEEQLKWIQNNPDGWDDKPFFESASGKLFGDNDYPENTHRMYLSPSVVQDLFKDFVDVKVTPAGARMTDMVVEAHKKKKEEVVSNLSTLASESNTITTEQMRQITDQTMLGAPFIQAIANQTKFNQVYFNGGHYKPFYWDFPQNEIITQNILKHRPKSVLELGCARGYVLKRIQDRGIRGCGLDVSKHCWLTRACEGIIQHDLTQTPWPFKDKEFDLCYSHDVLQWLPEQSISVVRDEMLRVSARCLHSVPTGTEDLWFDRIGPYVGFDRTQIVSLEEMVQGQFPQELLKGNGKVKLNLGSFMTMFHGWINLDVHNLTDFANQNGYRFVHHDLRNGLPQFGTESVDYIYLCHVLEHFSYADGLTLLKECRRVLKPSGTIRIVVPDAKLLLIHLASDMNFGGWEGSSFRGSLSDFDELSDGCANATTSMGKLHALLYEGHQATYDDQTLENVMNQAGLIPEARRFRYGNQDILTTTVDMMPCVSLYYEGSPKTT